jgi:ATP-dependent Clp protease, protease subunit
MSHPVVVRENTENGYEQFDIFSRLFEDRIIYIDTDFNDYMASLVCSQLLVLSNQSDEDITIYVNSPGGSCSSGLAIYDTMQMIPNNIKIVCVGEACSMGAFLLSSGTKGHRYATPNSRIMIHMVSSGASGTIKDMEISFAESKVINDILHERLAIHCGKTVAQLLKATDRDCWMSAEEAKKFGIIDEVLKPQHDNAWGAK